MFWSDHEEQRNFCPRIILKKTLGTDFSNGNTSEVYTLRRIIWGRHNSCTRPWDIKLAHEAGVKIYGTVFLPEGNAGGSFDDAKALVENNNQVLHQLVRVAKDLVFDGWFLNMECPESSASENQTFVRQLNEFLQNNSSGIEFIPYVARNQTFYGISGRITDDNINEMGLFYIFDLFRDANIMKMKNRFRLEREYLLFIGEPVWNLMSATQLSDHQANLNSRYGAISKVFEGSVHISNGTREEWLGLKYYAKRADVSLRKLPYCFFHEGSVNIARYSAITKINKEDIYNIVDGDIDSNKWVQINEKYVEFDLGEEIAIHQIKMWHYYLDSRIYHDVAVTVSNSANHEQFTTIFNNDSDTTKEHLMANPSLRKKIHPLIQ